MRDYVKSTAKRGNLNGDIGVNVMYETPVKCKILTENRYKDK